MVGTGVVAEAGGIIVALAPTVAGAGGSPSSSRTAPARRPTGWGPTRPPGIVVLRIPDDLPAAAFTAGDPGTGSVAVAMSEEPGSASALRVAAPVRRTVALRRGGGPTRRDTGFCATAVAPRSPPTTSAARWWTASGAVAGHLRCRGRGGSRATSVFLPAELVRTWPPRSCRNGTVDHGRLGAAWSTAVGAGAGWAVPVVASVDPRRVGRPGRARARVTASSPSTAPGCARWPSSPPGSTPTLPGPSSRSPSCADGATFEHHRRPRRRLRPRCRPRRRATHRRPGLRRSMGAWHRPIPATRATRSSPCSAT